MDQMVRVFQFQAEINLNWCRVEIDRLLLNDKNNPFHKEQTVEQIFADAVVCFNKNDLVNTFVKTDTIITYIAEVNKRNEH